MRRTRSPRDFRASAALLAAGGLALALGYGWAPLAARGTPPAGLLLVLILAGAAGAWYRPLAGSSTLGLGAAVVPLALWLAGPAPAAALAAGCFLVGELSLRLVRRLAAHRLPERRNLLRSLEGSARAALAVLAAGGVWSGLRYRWEPVAVFALAGLLYLLLAASIEALDQKAHRPGARLRPLPLLGPLALDASGWAVGSALALVGFAADWALAAFLLAAFALLAAETVRNRLLLEESHLRIHDLERLTRAGERMITPAEEMTAVAERIRVEAQKVLPFQWFHFEALAPGSEFRSWWAGPDGGPVREGVPRPDRFPPALPGFHRRVPWQVLDRPFRADGLVLARLRLWCDPRRLSAEEVELLDTLLPQMTASVQRCLLDREAREDPLTGASMRRVLETRLHEAHTRACAEGGSVAVVLCDLDHFKKINDTWGHPVGDRALVAVAGEMKEVRRTEDLLCRYGGEEFVLLLEATTGEAALAIAERLRLRVERYEFLVDGERVPLTLSAGVAAFPDLYIKTAAELILFADEALYEAKRLGRNRCLLDLGQGRYQDVEGNLHVTEEADAPAAEPPRIFV